MSIVLPDHDTLLELHRRSLERDGGAGGVRDAAALDAALARPRQMEGYDPNVTLFGLVAALTVSLVCHRHPFVDGNKRMGLITAYVTLALNGYHLDTTEMNAYRTILGVAEGEISESALAAWLERHALADESA